MKFVIDSKEFKNVTERASIVCSKKGLFCLTSLFIIADKENQLITVKATNMDSFAEVYTDYAKVYESGKFYVELENLKRLYNVSGEITVESTENSVKVRSNKKQSEVPTNSSDEIEFPSVKHIGCFSADKEEMLDTFSKLSCCLSTSDAKKIMTGFNIRNNHIAACDGYRVAMRDVEWNFANGLNITIPGYVCKELSKVSANKREENIKVFCDDKNKFVRFVGFDFAYTTRLLEGVFFDVDTVMNFGDYPTYSFDVKADSLFAISKEYHALLKNIQGVMYIFHINGKFVAVAMSPSYKTSDIVETENENNVPDNLRYAFNPRLINGVAGIFGKQTITIESVLNKGFTGWKFKGENGYSALVLPVRPQDDLSDVENFAASA